MKITFMNPKGSSAESDAFTTNPLRRYIAFGDATSRYIVESLPDEDLTLHTRALLESLLRDVNDFEDGEFARLAVAAASSLHEVPCPKVDESTGNALPPPTRIGARRFLVVIAMQAGLLGLRLSVLGEVEKQNSGDTASWLSFRNMRVGPCTPCMRQCGRLERRERRVLS